MQLRTKGYITVFLSLSIMIILSLVLALYQGARVGAARMKTECVADISMNSVLAEYSRALYEQYGLLMVDCSYGTGSHSITNTEGHLKNYIQKNFDRSTVGRIKNSQTMTALSCEDAKITGFSFATDNGGAVLNRQILEYMTADPLTDSIEDVIANVGILTDSGFDTTDVDEMARNIQEQIDDTDIPILVDEDGEEYQPSIGNPADAVNSLRGIGALNLAIKNLDSVSKATVNLSEYASHRQKNKGTGLSTGVDPNLVQQLLLEQYYYEKCSRYGEELEKSLLKYQLEYLIYGKPSDYKNLEKMAETLLFWRQASNMLYLFGCSSKVKEVELIAGALSIIFFVPELKDLLKYSILFAWTFAESISDLNILFKGGRVPLIKSDSSWQLSLTKMFSFRDHLNGGDCGEGLYYKDYLRMRLFMADKEKKSERFMDIVEMDIRKTKGNSGFRLDDCLDSICAEMTVTSQYGYKAKIERIYGYEEK